MRSNTIVSERRPGTSWRPPWVLWDRRAPARHSQRRHLSDNARISTAMRNVNSAATQASAYRQAEMPSWSSAVPGPAIYGRGMWSWSSAVPGPAIYGRGVWSWSSAVPGPAICGRGVWSWSSAVPGPAIYGRGMWSWSSAVPGPAIPGGANTITRYAIGSHLFESLQPLAGRLDFGKLGVGVPPELEELSVVMDGIVRPSELLVDLC